MTRIQQVVDTLFEQFPANDLGSGPERYQFDRLRDVLTTSEDWPSTLRRLYQADRCDEFALGLLWMTERLEQDVDRTTALPDEEEVFQRALRKGLALPDAAFSGFGAGSPETQSEFEPANEPGVSFDLATGEEASPAPETGTMVDAPTMEASPDAMAETPSASESVTTDDSESAGSTDEEPGGGPIMPMEDDDGGTSDQEIYGRLLERFLEAVQSGGDDRSELLGRLRANHRAIQSDTTVPEEYQRYAGLMEDFLGYIDEHQLLDDVRVMNLVTNLQEPFGQWLSTDEANRPGILDQCVEMHRDFRTMFE